MFTLFLAPFFSKVDTFEGALNFFYDAVESFLLDYKVEPRGKVDLCVCGFSLRKKMVEDVETKRGTDSYILLTVPLG